MTNILEAIEASIILNILNHCSKIKLLSIVSLIKEFTNFNLNTVSKSLPSKELYDI